MKQLFDTIAQAEMLGFAFLVIAAMVICVAIIFFFVLIVVLDKKSIRSNYIVHFIKNLYCP